MEKFAKPGDFCPNAACLDYQKLQGGQWWAWVRMKAEGLS